MLTRLSGLVLVCSLALSAASLKVAVTDPSKALVPDATVRIESVSGLVTTKNTGADGNAVFEDLSSGTYRVTAAHEGFEDAQRDVEVKTAGETVLEIALKIASQETAVEVDTKLSSAANSDPNYRALRAVPIAESYIAENIELKRDAATITLRSGTLSFAAPVLGHVTTAVFSGQGTFHLTPAVPMEADHLRLMTGQPQFDEEFDSAVFLFTDGTYDELRKSLKTSADGAKAGEHLKDFRKRARSRVETPRSSTEDLLRGEDIANLDAELLADLYREASVKADFTGSFSAYLHSRKHPDLRYFFKPLGALPQMLSTEESGLVNLDTGETQDGILYLTHSQAELQSGTASNSEDRRIVMPVHYKIETVIGRNTHFTSSASLQFQALRDGDRIFRLDLLPSLRVTRVSLNGKDIGYIQEARRSDGSFYVTMPEPMTKGQTQEIQIEYQGDKVVRDAGGGNFAVGARTSWYPSLNSFRDRCTYDLTFKVPRNFTLVAVGKLADQGREGGFAVTHWVSDVPLAVAGFNYGDFKQKSTVDKATNYEFDTYATSELPDYLRRFSEIASMTPSAMANSAMVDAENAIRCFQHWFGDAPYGRISITQQPQYNFGQSWPTLVYLPVLAFLDSTQRYMILGSNTFRYGDFIDEVLAHEVSHQWWGHLVGWSSYHDQWLSEGFADFSASLFLELTEKNRDKYQAYWERQRKEIIEKNSFGNADNDAGPLWMGERLNTFRTEGAYQRLVYPKGAFVLQMLRYMMRDQKTGDENFIKMMHDFTAQYAQKNATTEQFRRVVEQHMTPQMDLAGDQTMNWFFKQWVYGTEIPSYHLGYTFTPEAEGKVLITMKLTQSGVSQGFRARVPVYLDFGQPGGPLLLGTLAVAGSNTTNEMKVRLPQKPKKVLLNYNHDVLAREASAGEQ